MHLRVWRVDLLSWVPALTEVELLASLRARGSPDHENCSVRLRQTKTKPTEVTLVANTEVSVAETYL
jgi:hypothetical protein